MSSSASISDTTARIVHAAGEHARPNVRTEPRLDFTEQLRRLEPEALDRLARAEAPRVERFLRRLLGPRQDMEDLVQTVFLELCRVLPRFRGDSSISTLVLGVAVRIARRAIRPTAWTLRRRALPEEMPSPQAGGLRQTIAHRQLESLQAALERLPAKRRIAFVLWAVEGLAAADIAQAVGTSEASVRQHVSRAQRDLRSFAKDDPYLQDLVVGGAHE